MGTQVIREKFNCHKAYAKGLLEQEYDRLGVTTASGISEEAVAKERRELDVADFVFSASPMVRHSLLENGVSAPKVLDSAYGWEPGRLRHRGSSNRDEGTVRFLFVGRLCVRKGVHLLLRYWSEAGIDGELVLAGVVDDEVEEVAGDVLRRSDVHSMGRVEDVAALYQRSDVFVFPSLEEGGPLVTYEAMACGLSVIVSAMGAGAVVDDDVHGFVRSPFDREGWLSCLQRLAESRELRSGFGRAGAERMKHFTWADVGKRREELVVNSVLASD